MHSAGMRPARTSSQLGLLGRVIAPNVVRRVLQESHAGDRLRGAFRDDEERVCRSYRKTFAILVLVDMVCNVPDFTLCGLDDLRLPMPDVGTRDASPPPDETSREVTRKWPRRDVDHFKTYQWHVLAPVLTAQDSEYSLCPSHNPFVEPRTTRWWWFRHSIQNEDPPGYLWVWPALSAGLKHNRLQHLPSSRLSEAACREPQRFDRRV